MADIKISQLPSATTPLAGTEEVPLVQSGTTKKATVSEIVGSISVIGVTATAPVVSSGGNTPNISMAAATASVSGYLTSSDWSTFNSKQPAGSYLTNGGALGTPSSGTATNLTGLPLSTGVTGLLPVANGGTGTATPSIVAGTNVTVSGTWPNQTINASGAAQVYPGAGIANSTGTAWGTSYTTTGTGTIVALATSPALTSPIANQINDTNNAQILGLSPTTSAVDYLVVKNGVGVGVPLHIYADGTSANTGLHIQPKGTGLVTISDGTDFNKGIRFRSSSSAASAVTLLDAVSTAGRVVTLPDATTTLVGRDTTDTLTNKTIAFGSNTFSGTLAVANGGTGTATPALVAGTNVTITGTWPNQTINATGGGGSGDVVGPASATDNAIARFDGTTGKLIQNSAVTIADDGTTVISTSSASDALRITQTGAGNAILVEDSANPDATPFVVDTNGQVIQGYTSAISSGVVATNPNFQMHGITNATTAIGLTNWSSTGARTPSLNFNRSAGNAVNTRGALTASGTSVGMISFTGDDGTSWLETARIEGAIDGTPGTNDMPGRLVFSTTADGASTPTERMRIANNGEIGIGSSNAAGQSVRLAKVITGSVNSYGLINAGIVQSDVTSNAYYFRSSVSTAASAFTLTALSHYSTIQGTIGAGSTVTNQYGYLADSSLTGATNNYGFYGNIASGTGRYNLYMVGTASNYMAGSLGIATTSPGSALDVKGTLRLSGATSGYVGFAPAAAAGSTTYTLPSADGTTGQLLSTNGSGTLSWATGGGGGTPGGSTTQVQYNNAGAFGGITGATSDGTALTLTGAILNGTIGATTPSTGAFTTLNASGALGVTGAVPSDYTYYNDLALIATADGGLTIRSGTSDTVGIAFADGLTGNAQYRGRILYKHSTDTLQLGASGDVQAEISSTGLAVTGLVDISAATSGQIKFPATQNASSNANTLDDYEEGTWTPTAATGGYTLSTVSGKYTKIGNVVYINFFVTFSAVGGNPSQTTFGGLPFTKGTAGTGAAREGTTTGAMYMVASSGATTVELNSATGVSGTRTIRTGEEYICTYFYYV